MKETILQLIKHAENNEDVTLIYLVKDLIDELAITINCPSNW